MIDWAGVARNLAWIAGLASMLAGASMASYRARLDGVRWWTALRDSGARLAWDAGLALLALGLLLTGRWWWERLAWGLVLILAVVVAVQSARRLAREGLAATVAPAGRSPAAGTGWPRRAARRLAGLELWIVGLGVAPVLIFEAWMPRWLIGVALAAIPALWLARWIGRGRPTRPTPLDGPLAILLLTIPVGVWTALDRSLALPEVYRLVLGVALFYALANSLTSERRLAAIQALILPAMAVLILASVWGTLWVGGKLPLPGLQAMYERLPGQVRPFWNPDGFSANIVGGTLAMLLPVAAASAWGARRPWLKAGWAAVFLAGGLVLVLTQSRGAIVALAAALLAMVAVRSRRLLAAIPVLGVVGVLALWLSSSSQAGQALLASATQRAAGSVEGRLEIWSRVVYMIQDFPLTGIGLGMFDRVLDTFYPLFVTPARSSVFHPHNVYLAAAVDGGLPALIAFLALAGLLVYMALQSIRLARGGQFRGLAAGLFGALVAYMTHGLFDSITSFIKAGAIGWVLFGLQAAVWLYLREKPPDCREG